MGTISVAIFEDICIKNVINALSVRTLGLFPVRDQICGYPIDFFLYSFVAFNRRVFVAFPTTKRQVIAFT